MHLMCVHNDDNNINDDDVCLFVFSLCISSSVCFCHLDRFTSSSPHVALLLLSQIYFFIVLGPNALTVQPVSSEKTKGALYSVFSLEKK